MTHGVGVDLSLGQLRDAWRLMCTACPGHSLAQADGIEFIFSGLPIGFFNVALLNGRNISGDALRASGRAACEWVSGKDVPWMFVVTHECLVPGTDAESILDGCGLGRAMSLTGMFARQVAPLVSVPVGLKLAVPQNDAGCAALLNVNSAAYDMEFEAGKGLLGRKSFWNGHVPVIGFVDEEACCCAAVLMVEGFRYVAMVATVPAQQRRGYGEAAMRHALEVAARLHGECPTVLHATEVGRPIYERMGYTAIAAHTVYMDKKFLESH